MDITEYAMMKKVFKKLSPDSEPVLQEKTITENGEYTPDDGYDGLSKVIVNVEGGGGGSADLVYVTFKTHDGAKELHTRAVVKGNTCMCPVTGVIKEIDAPTRESTAQYNYTFAGWATTPNGGLDENALKDVTEDRTVYANYIATIRTYAVRFFDGNTQVGETQYVAYGGVATPPVIDKEGMEFGGWNPAYDNITGDTDCYAVWVEQITFANSTWERIAEVCSKGEHKQHFAVGDTRTIYVTYNGAQYQNILKIVGMDHDDLADGSGKAPLSIMIFTLMVQSKYSTNSKFTGMYDTSTARDAVVAYESYLPSDLQAVIKPVLKTCNNFGSKGVNANNATTERTWLPSTTEICGNTDSGVVGAQYEAFLTDYFTLGSNLVYDTDGNVMQAYKSGTNTVTVWGWTRHGSINYGYGVRWANLLNYAGGEYVNVLSCGNSSATSNAPNFSAWLPIGFCV